MLANRFGLLQANTSTFFFLIVSNLNLLSLRSDWSVIGKLRKQILGIQFLYKLEWRCDRGRLRALVNYSYFVCGCTCFTDCWDLIQNSCRKSFWACYLHWTRASSKQNGATADELPPSYSTFSEPCSIEPVCFSAWEKWFVFTIFFRGNFYADHDINFMFVI